jgi:hypothetical protein
MPQSANSRVSGVPAGAAIQMMHAHLHHHSQHSKENEGRQVDEGSQADEAKKTRAHSVSPAPPEVNNHHA